MLSYFLFAVGLAFVASAWSRWYAGEPRFEPPLWGSALLFFGLLALSVSALSFAMVLGFPQAMANLVTGAGPVGGLGFRYGIGRAWFRLAGWSCWLALVLATFGVGRARTQVLIATGILLGLALAMAAGI